MEDFYFPFYLPVWFWGKMIQWNEHQEKKNGMFFLILIRNIHVFPASQAGRGSVLRYLIISVNTFGRGHCQLSFINLLLEGYYATELFSN